MKRLIILPAAMVLVILDLINIVGDSWLFPAMTLTALLVELVDKILRGRALERLQREYDWLTGKLHELVKSGETIAEDGPSKFFDALLRVAEELRVRGEE